jgi:two-component system CheB/CheR fusion protein
MVHQSARNSTSVEDFTSKLDGRISALANSQKLLVDSVWEGTDFLRLVEQQLAPYLDDRRRVHIAGEPIVLPADLATPFGLVLHELATNAAKYGALSGDKGRVNLSWSMEKGNGGDLLKVVWEENDGPAVCQPRMAGFGSHLIEQGLPGATVNHDFLAEGIRCRIELPLPKREWIA